ncbi:MAG: SPOR domain-containing protein, partial [Lachnospiraceae bacterium]
QSQERLYRVQTGAFKRREYAEDLLYRLLSQNFPAYILREDDYYKVQVGAFRQLDNAVRMEEALRRQGYATFITM